MFIVHTCNHQFPVINIIFIRPDIGHWIFSLNMFLLILLTFPTTGWHCVNILRSFVADKVINGETSLNACEGISMNY